ncbi:CREB-binding protein-like isoform X2 [Leptotrombidium deliense]|uniref:histone acetyltransferase n=1 Tax=Leptotrombidium deliense TaxID=299467 RepID=A0A443SM56_9ACAR|nr:CREB-binding protein-like isoform X2 [Leptotrombidium deliense]
MAQGFKPVENKFSAKCLKQTQLGEFIENRVNDFLRKKDCNTVRVHIRVVSSSDKFTQVKDLMRKKYFDKDDWSDKIPYRSKTILAFTEINRFDVCFFGFYVQEYGTNSSFLNSRCVYLSYLDSVNFFSPKKYRTDVYHEILLGYMNYVKLMGFVKVYIWACPPLKDSDYIFHRHPNNQKVPTQKRLQTWYNRLFKKGSNELIVTSFKNIFDQAKEDNFKSATELPYFEGDFWPNVIEESIKEIEMEQQNQMQAKLQLDEYVSNSDVSLCPSLFEKENATFMETTMFKSLVNNWHFQQWEQELTAKLYAAMEKHKDVYFVVCLNNAGSANLPPISDPDDIINCDLMDGRDAFLMMAREKHYEFSSLRRAIFSTMALLYELHNGTNKCLRKDGYSCNNCQRCITEPRYHCLECDDFDLCSNCFTTVGHNHRVEKYKCNINVGKL